MLSFCIIAVIVFLGVFAYEMERVHQGERDVWQQERKELYDRIQASLCRIQAG